MQSHYGSEPKIAFYKEGHHRDQNDTDLDLLFFFSTNSSASKMLIFSVQNTK